MTSSSLHDPTALNTTLAELPPLPMAALMIGVYNLLQEGADLPQPGHVSVSEITQHITLQFSPEPASLKAITRWALRFGSVMDSEPHQAEHGPQTWCRTEFTYYGLTVKAFAHIPAEPASN